jgi:CBS domain-containing protein
MPLNNQQKSISEIMSRNMCMVAPEQTVIEALARMRSKSVSSVLVIENDRVCGIITERDFVRAVHTNVDFKKINCAGLMHSPVVSVSPGTSCLDSYHQMVSNNIRHIVVTDNAGIAVGLASEGDLMRDFGIEYYMHFKNVGGVMRTDACLLKATAFVADAVELMIERQQSCVMVVDDARRPVGVLTERDIVHLCGDHPQSESMQLSEVMRGPVKTVTEKEMLHEAVKLMSMARIRRLAVVDGNGAIIGLLTHHEIVREMEGDYLAHFKALADMHARGQIQFKPLIDEKLVLATLSRAAPETAMLATDLNFHIGYSSPGASSLLGLGDTECIGADVRDVLQLIGWEQAHDDIREGALSDGKHAHEAKINGRSMSMRVFLMHDAQQAPCGLLVRVQRVA